MLSALHLTPQQKLDIVAVHDLYASAIARVYDERKELLAQMQASTSEVPCWFASAPHRPLTYT